MGGWERHRDIIQIFRFLAVTAYCGANVPDEPVGIGCSADPLFFICKGLVLKFSPTLSRRD